MRVDPQAPLRIFCPMSAPLQPKTIAKRVLRSLAKLYPDAHCALHHEGSLQLLVATILSAQCTDVAVNKVTPTLFARCPTAKDYAEIDDEELQAIIKPTGFFRNKAKSIKAAAKLIGEVFKGGGGGGLSPQQIQMMQMQGQPIPPGGGGGREGRGQPALPGSAGRRSLPRRQDD